MQQPSYGPQTVQYGYGYELPPRRSTGVLKGLLISALIVGGLLAGAYYVFVVRAPAPNTAGLPDSILGFARITDVPELVAEVDTSRAKVLAGASATAVDLAFYRVAGTPPESGFGLYLIEAIGRFNPDAEKNELSISTAAGVGAANVRSLEADVPGREVMCGEGVAESVPLASCTWVDEHTIIVAVFVQRSVAQAMPNFEVIVEELLIE